jgi:dTDP-4-dehydrorhamnose 3,5-epimerase
VKVCDSKLIDGVLICEIDEISTGSSTVFKFIEEHSLGFVDFAECYMTEVLPGSVKAWKYYDRMTQNVCVPVGAVKFVIYDDRDGSRTNGIVNEFHLERTRKFARLTIPPRLWYGFGSLCASTSIIVNVIDVPHQGSNAIGKVRQEPNIPYIW